MPLVKGASNWIVIGLIVTALTGLLMGRVVDTGSTVLRQFLLVASMAGHGALIVGATMFGRGRQHFILHDRPLRSRHAVMGGMDAAPARCRTGRFCGLGDGRHVHLMGTCALLGRHLLVRSLPALVSRNALAGASFRRIRLCPGLCPDFAVLCLRAGGYFSHNLFGLHKAFHFDAVLCSAVNIAFVLIIARPQLKSVRNMFAAVLLAIALGMTWQAPAVGMGALTLVFGFARGHRWLMWLGGAMLVFGVGRFYYDLQLILLHKASLMFLGEFCCSL